MQVPDLRQALDGLVNDSYDRAAPLGQHGCTTGCGRPRAREEAYRCARCGDCKAAGNYAADLESMYVSKRTHKVPVSSSRSDSALYSQDAVCSDTRKGYPISLYLDAVERRYVEEFNTSNFVAITKDLSTLRLNPELRFVRANRPKIPTAGWQIHHSRCSTECSRQQHQQGNGKNQSFAFAWLCVQHA